jgi:hypothetical protein
VKILRGPPQDSSCCINLALVRGWRRGSRRGLRAALVAALVLAALGGGAPARAGLYWSAPIPVVSAKLRALSCPSTSLCVGVDFGGDVLVSGTPTLGSSAWSSAKIAASLGLDDVSCAPQTTLCAAVGNAGIFVSTDPAGGTAAWQRVTESPPAISVSCPGPGLCVAGGPGVVFTSTQPANAAQAWTESAMGGVSLDDISCPSTTLCVAVNRAVEGGIVTSTDPTGSFSWTAAPIGPGHLSEVSCPTTSFCVALGEQTLASTTSPAAGAASWKIDNHLFALREIRTLACASASLCAAAGAPNGVVASSSSPSVAESWERVEGVDGNNELSPVSCPSEAMCFAADDALVVGVAAHRLTVTTTGAGEGSVRSGPLVCPFGCTYSGPVCPRNCSANQFPNAFIPFRLSEIACGESEFADGTKSALAFCAQLYPAQDMPALTPEARPGSVFTGWRGDCVGREACVPSMSTDRSVTALFEPKLSLHAVKQRRRRWRERRGHTHVPVGSGFSFELNRAANVTLSFTRAARGRRVGRSCRPLSKPARHAHVHRCTRRVAAGRLSLNEPAGADAVAFTGIVTRAGRPARLRPGAYAVTLIASGEGETTPPAALSFTIAR